MKRILLTGASGFIGSHLISYFSRCGYEVTAFCRTPKRLEALSRTNIRIVQGLIEDYELVRELVRSQDAVVHCALGWGETATDMVRNDTAPSVHLFEQAIAANVRKIIFTSSVVAVGECRSLMTEETPSRPVDLYSATKSAVEGFLLALSRNTETECNIIRPVYTFGYPAASGCNSQPDRRFWDMANAAAEGKEIHLIRNEGTQFIFIDKLLEVYEHLIQTPGTRRIITAGSDSQHSWESIARQIISYMRSPSTVVFQELNWAPGGCVWSNDSMKQVLPEAADCTRELREHVKYVCDIVLASKSTHCKTSKVCT